MSDTFEENEVESVPQPWRPSQKPPKPASVKDVLNIFNLPDSDFVNSIQQLPVADVNALSSDLLSGESFSYFVGYMQLIIYFELKIQEELLKIYNVLLHLRLKNTDITNSTNLHNIIPDTNTHTIPHKTQNTIKTLILAHHFYKHQLNKKRRAFREQGITQWRKSLINHNKIWMMTNTHIVQGFEFITSNFNKSFSDKEMAAMLAGIQAEINKSNDRISRNRRSEFRKALTSNYKVIFEKFLKTTSEDSYELHNTKIDRLVIDIYSPDLLTYDELLKSHLDDKERHLRIEFDKREIPTQDFIDAIKSIYRNEFKSIDELVDDFERERSRRLQQGYEQKGLFISQLDWGKVIFTYNPDNTGAPIRLRIITNVQDAVRRDLFRDFPEKEDIYKQRTWAGTEVNFILPEDYEYYLTKEFSFCSWLEWNSKHLFMDYVEEYLGMEVKPESLVAYVSQVEVCYEKEFRPNKPSPWVYRDKSKVPNLFHFMHMKQLSYHKFSNAYCNTKYDGLTGRPSLHMDIFSINPEFPIMQYKIYPKFYNSNKNVMLRHEFIPTRFIKFLTLEEDDTPLSQKVLSNPWYVREIVERLFQFELQQNAVRGLGYNKRFKLYNRPTYESLSTSIFGKAIFGNRADQFEIELEKIKYGRIPNTIPLHYRNKMVEMGIATKIRRGVYTTTKPFSEMVKKLYQVR